MSGAHQFGRFVAGGVVNTAVTYAVFAMLVSVTTPSVAYTIAYVGGIGLSYVINTRFVFRRSGTAWSALRYPGVYAIQYVGGLALLSGLTTLGLDSRVAMLIVIGSSVGLTFVVIRFLLERAP